jgi:hypothetical protein
LSFVTTKADQLPVVDDDDDDWLGKMLTEESTRSVAPASAESWKENASPQAKLRRELVNELTPAQRSSEPAPTILEPLADLPENLSESLNESDLSEESAPPVEPPAQDGLPGPAIAVDEPPLPVQEEVDERPTEPVAMDGGPPAPLADDSSPEGVGLSHDEVESLMSALDEDSMPAEPDTDRVVGNVADPPPALANPAPAEGGEDSKDEARAVCPSGRPQPKIDLKSMQKQKAPQSPEQVARLFGGPPPIAEPPSETDTTADRPLLTFEEPVAQEKPIPAWMLALDNATSRVRQIHPMLPTLAGVAGVLLIGNGLLILAFATLGLI